MVDNGNIATTLHRYAPLVNASVKENFKQKSDVTTESRALDFCEALDQKGKKFGFGFGGEEGRRDTLEKRNVAKAGGGIWYIGIPHQEVLEILLHDPILIAEL
jgi:hypothetical protein